MGTFIILLTLSCGCVYVGRVVSRHKRLPTIEELEEQEFFENNLAELDRYLEGHVK